MPNMSYCRFGNTLKALKDCRENLRGSISQEEDLARQQLIEVCRQIVTYADNPEVSLQPITYEFLKKMYPKLAMLAEAVVTDNTSFSEIHNIDFGQEHTVQSLRKLEDAAKDLTPEDAEELNGDEEDNKRVLEKLAPAFRKDIDQFLNFVFESIGG